MSNISIRPLANQLVVECEVEKTTPGGIVIPETSEKDKPSQGKVKAVGKGKVIDGKLQPLEVKVGDTILFGKYAGTNFKLNNKDYLIMREEDVMGVME